MGTSLWWAGIEPSSPLITYTGEWNMTDPRSYRPSATQDTPANATLDFSGELSCTSPARQGKGQALMHR